VQALLSAGSLFLIAGILFSILWSAPMVRNLVLAAAVMMFAVTALMQTASAEEKKPLSVKQVMGKAMNPKKGLLGKVLKGGASDADKAMLVSLMEDLAANDAPRGDAASWKAKTEALVAAAKTVKEGGSTAALNKAKNCAACHKAHKPKK